MTCKDCIHRELCADYVSSLAKVQNADVKYISQWLDEIEGKRNQTDNGCEHFADRSWFVELPCKVGDLIYIIKKARGLSVRGAKVNSITITESGKTQVSCYRSSFTGFWGDDAFATKEEAEQALKECEANANDLPQSNNHS